MTTTVIDLDTLRNERQFPFCPGCGHSTILDALDAALVRRGTAPEKTVIVTDIGCAGLSDQYFATSGLHGLHGRSITYATGIKLARPDLDVIVIMGDGGTGIGGAHLLAAARRNIGITLIVMNNFNFGMTGGQHSSTTPEGATTSTTPLGNLERPLDIRSTVAVNGSAYSWRGTSFDDDLVDRIEDAMGVDGFALLDVWELCTAYYVRTNTISRKTIHDIMGGLGLDPGLVVASEPRTEFAAALHAMAGQLPPAPPPKPTPTSHRSLIDGRFVLEAAGSAGGKVRSAVRIVAAAGVRSGLFTAQHDDYPTTVKKGHSASTVVFDPDPIRYAGADHPDAVVALTTDGVNRIRSTITAMAAESTIVAPVGLDLPETAARAIRLDPKNSPTRLGPASMAPALISAAAVMLGIVSPEAIRDAAAGFRSADAFEAGIALVDAIGSD